MRKPTTESLSQIGFDRKRGNSFTPDRHIKVKSRVDVRPQGFILFVDICVRDHISRKEREREGDVFGAAPTFPSVCVW